MATEPDSDSDSEKHTDEKPPEETRVDAAPASDEERRDFLIKAGSFVFGGIVVAAPVGAGLMTFFSPLMKESAKGIEVRLASIDELPSDGTPKRYDIVDEKDDAWMKFEKKPIGGVFLRKMPDGSVIAFNASCPHAGCSVKFIPADGNYYCPCHKSEFEIDGSRGERCVSARALDRLEVKLDDPKQGDVTVVFKNFRAGIADKQEVS